MNQKALQSEPITHSVKIRKEYADILIESLYQPISESREDDEQNADSAYDIELSEIARYQLQTSRALRTEPIYKQVLNSIKEIYALLLRNDIAMLLLFNIANGMLAVDFSQYYYTFKIEVAGITKA